MANRKTHRDDAIPVRAEDRFLDQRSIDPLMSVVIALGSEFWAMQRRLLVIETLLDGQGSVTRDAIERFTPSAEQAAAWEALRDRYIRRVYGVLDEDADARAADAAGGKGGER